MFRVCNKRAQSMGNVEITIVQFSSAVDSKKNLGQKQASRFTLLQQKLPATLIAKCK